MRGAYQLSGEQYLGFTEDDAKSSWHNDGSYRRFSKLHPLDIIALDPPPMTEAEMRDALAEIAKQTKRLHDEVMRISVPSSDFLSRLGYYAQTILALAEGKS